MGRQLELQQVTITAQPGARTVTRLARNRQDLITDLMPSILHELAQPLASIMIESTVRRRAAEKCLTDTASELASVDRTKSEAIRAAHLVESIAWLTRSRPVCITIVDLNDLVHRTVEMIRQDLHERGGSIKLSLADGLPALSTAPDATLEVILRTALATARSGGEPGFVLTLETSICPTGGVSLSFHHSNGLVRDLHAQFAGCGVYAAALEGLGSEDARVSFGENEVRLDLNTLHADALTAHDRVSLMVEPNPKH